MTDAMMPPLVPERRIGSDVAFAVGIVAMLFAYVWPALVPVLPPKG